uniref:Uncharacterized protein n=1 Tax=Anguilla anguilla TaxID=7936 RepID=A0A0E9WFK2_ANGAN
MRLEINSNLVDLVTARVYILHNLGKKNKKILQPIFDLAKAFTYSTQEDNCKQTKKANK